MKNKKEKKSHNWFLFAQLAPNSELSADKKKIKYMTKSKKKQYFRTIFFDYYRIFIENKLVKKAVLRTRIEGNPNNKVIDCNLLFSEIVNVFTPRKLLN